MLLQDKQVYSSGVYSSAFLFMWENSEEQNEEWARYDVKIKPPCKCPYVNCRLVPPVYFFVWCSRMCSGEVTVLSYSSTVVSKEKMIMSPWDHEYHRVSMCDGTYQRCDDKPQSAQKQYFEEKWKIKNGVLRGEKAEVAMHIFFSRQIQYRMLLLLAVPPFWRWWVDNLKYSTENDFREGADFPRQPLSYVHDSKTGVQQIKEPCFLSEHPMQVSCFVYLAFLTKH